uniref:Uncharacterized protein n=1 Tax=Panagrolaimus sp. JU765 TaxID=591449 RepID=A0AC34RIE3_9BILA
MDILHLKEILASKNKLPIWQRKRFKHLNNQYGVKPDVLNHQIATPARTPAGIDVLGELVNALPTAEEGSTKKLTRISRAFSIEQKPTGLEKRESVFGMAVDTIKELVNGTPFHSTKNNALQKNTGRVSLRSHQ